MTLLEHLKNINAKSKEKMDKNPGLWVGMLTDCLLYTSPSPRDAQLSRMPSSA